MTRESWTRGQITDPTPRDKVLDHLILVVHGIGTNGDTLPQYVTHLRKTFDAEWQRKYLDIPLTIAVDAISWHDMARAPQETMANITLPTVPQIRSMINDTLLDVLYYRSPVYGRRLISAVARLLNDKVALYKKTFPNFSGQVSLFCHSLGSVIMFDLLQKQGRKDGPGGEHWAGTNPGLTVSELEGGEGEWEWPQLNFKVENMFGLGSPVAMFLTTRGDIHQEDWKREATSFTFPGGAHFRNIFDPTDPVAFRFEPLINPHYSKFPPAVIPARNRRAVLGEATHATRADFYGWERIDYALQEGSETGLMGHVRAIAQAHYCYWFSKDLSMFIIHTLLNQKLYGHDSTQTATSQQAEAAGPKAPRGQRPENPLRAAEVERHAQELLTLKEQVMWLITSDLLSFEVPAIVGSRVAGASGTFNYAIGNLRVSSIDVPRHKVVVVFTRAGHVTIKITDASAQLRGFTWLYKQRGPPHLKDSGTADASISVKQLRATMSRRLTRQHGMDKGARSPAGNAGVHVHSPPPEDSARGEAPKASHAAGGFVWGEKRTSPEHQKASQSSTLAVDAASSSQNTGVAAAADSGGQGDRHALASGNAELANERGDLENTEADVRIKIRSLDITLHKHSSTMMGWLYRMLLSAFADRITSSVEHAVVVTLRERLSNPSKPETPTTPLTPATPGPRIERGVSDVCNTPEANAQRDA